MPGFFNYFPTTFHSNTVATNIIAKMKFDASVAKNLAVFYPYVISDGERADQIAANYYEDPSYDWVVYLSNNIIDPYHEWPMDQAILDNFVSRKYGSIANAQLQIAHYRVNYDTDERVISPAAYQALSSVQKQYWIPIFGYSTTPINYERKEMLDVVETNRIVSLTGTFGSFSENDIIKQSSAVMGTVSFANSTNLTIKHVSGTWQANTTVYTGLSNTVANATVTSVSNIYQALETDELAYWTPVYQYDLEQLKNENMKHIRLLNNTYLDKIETDMRELLQL